MDKKTRIGLVGCGNIMAQYVKGCRMFDILDIAACADLDMKLAATKAEEFDIPTVCTVDEMLADPDIQIVVNLTNPAAHAAVNLAAVLAGKDVYSEKPLAITREGGQQILAAAREHGALVGCAPDTVLGGGLQTCRKLIDEGAIGEPVAAVGMMAGHGPEGWHTNPHPFYQVGAGPLFDMGPYYLTALVNLLGPVAHVIGSARISFPERIATSKAHYGEKIPVEVPTHVTGALEFASGPIATIITSFDVWAHNLPRIEIYGSEGSLSVPDPNTFSGPVRLRMAGEESWREVPLIYRDDVVRGIGIADMAHARLSGRPVRASGEVAYHVLDIMHAFGDSAETGQRIDLASTCAQPARLPADLVDGLLD